MLNFGELVSLFSIPISEYDWQKKRMNETLINGSEKCCLEILQTLNVNSKSATNSVWVDTIVSGHLVLYKVLCWCALARRQRGILTKQFHFDHVFTFSAVHITVTNPLARKSNERHVSIFLYFNHPVHFISMFGVFEHIVVCFVRLSFVSTVIGLPPRGPPSTIQTIQIWTTTKAIEYFFLPIIWFNHNFS